MHLRFSKALFIHLIHYCQITLNLCLDLLNFNPSLAFQIRFIMFFESSLVPKDFNLGLIKLA